VRLAFSAPDRGPEERRALLTGYRAAGFDGLQLKRRQYDAYLPEPERFLADWGHEPGVASGLITGGDLGGDAIADLRRVIRFAAVAGSERIVYCHGLPRAAVNDDDIRRFAGLLSELGVEAQAAGVQLSLHHHYDQPVMHRSDLELFFAHTVERNVTLTVDTAHLVKSGVTDIPGVIRDFAQFIDNFHIKDIADQVFVPLGHGSIDFGPVFAAVSDIGYDGWLCADEESGAAIGDAMGASYRFFTRWVATVSGGVT
jgi:sugar phosphate isomerase/epimerase